MLAVVILSTGSEIVLRWSTETRDLGVIIVNKLNFNRHISDIAHKAHV